MREPLDESLMCLDVEIPGGDIHTLETEVYDFLFAADDCMFNRPNIGSGWRHRPPDSHGGAYLSQWRFERLRRALKERMEPVETLHKIREYES